MPKSTVSDIKLQKLGFKAYVKKKCSKYTGDQEERVKTGARHVYKKTLEKILIIDDESYSPFDTFDVPGNKFYHSTGPGEVGYDHQFKPVTKFLKRHMVWLATDENGEISEPFYAEGTVNSEVYLNECIKIRLIHFIHKHHKIYKIFFWSDLATSHFANLVTAYLKSKNIDLVDKKMSPPNFLQARGIETFWALRESAYSKRPNKPKSLKGFRQVMTKIMKDVAGW